MMQLRFLLDASTNVDKLIHLSSASIYQNYPISVIYESDYKLIDFYPPHEAYAKSKAFGSNEVFNYFELKQNWCSLILPHVIHSNNRRVLGNESFFNWLGNLILNHNMTPEDFRILNKLDMWSLRQFVHSEDVGLFITSLIRGDFHGGVIHLPNLPKINLFDFFSQLYNMLDDENPFKYQMQDSVQLKYIASHNTKNMGFKYDFSENKICKKLFLSHSELFF